MSNYRQQLSEAKLNEVKTGERHCVVRCRKGAALPYDNMPFCKGVRGETLGYWELVHSGTPEMPASDDGVKPPDEWIEPADASDDTEGSGNFIEDLPKVVGPQPVA